MFLENPSELAIGSQKILKNTKGSWKYVSRYCLYMRCQNRFAFYMKCQNQFAFIWSVKIGCLYVRYQDRFAFTWGIKIGLLFHEVSKKVAFMWGINIGYLNMKCQDRLPFYMSHQDKLPSWCIKCLIMFFSARLFGSEIFILFFFCRCLERERISENADSTNQKISQIRGHVINVYSAGDE